MTKQSKVRPVFKISSKQGIIRILEKVKKLDMKKVSLQIISKDQQQKCLQKTSKDHDQKYLQITSKLTELLDSQVPDSSHDFDPIKQVECYDYDDDHNHDDGDDDD